MKKAYSFRLLAVAVICCLSISISVAETHSLVSTLLNPVPIGTFADLQTAYATSQLSPVGTTTYLQFTANITTTADYSFIPDTLHPVSIDGNGKQFIIANNGTLGGSLTMSSNTTSGLIQIQGATVTNITGGSYSIVAQNAPIIYAVTGTGISSLTKVFLSNSVFSVPGFNVATGPTAASIIKFFTSGGNLISATNCIFNMSAQGIAFSCIGPQDIIIKDCTLNFAGSDFSAQAFNLAPTNSAFAASSLTIDGLALTMAEGSVFTTGGSRPINTIIRNITINGIATASMTAPTGGTGTKKFYDFRTFIPTVSVPEGLYLNQQSVTLTLTPTSILPVDAAGATIVYTTDGSEPIATSNAYTSPITVAVNSTIKMVAFKSGFIGKTASFAYAIGHTWTRTNPGGGGAFNCVKAGPTGIIVAGSDLSGAYMSKDKGVSFTCIGAPQGIPGTCVISVGFDPFKADKFFIGTISSLLRTTDGGLTFSKVINSGDFSDIVVCKSNSQYVYAAGHSSYKTVDGAIYLSTDGGSTFTNVSGNTKMRILKIISDPKNSSIIYYISGKARDGATACIARLYKSTNGGVTFSDITGGKGEVMDADIDPVTTSTVYMTTYTTFPGGNFYKSNDSGITWSAPITRTGGIFVKQDEPNRVRVIEPRAPASWNAGSGTWESTNGGSSFSKTGDVTQGWETGYNKSICTTSNFWDVFKSYNGTGFEGIVRGFGTDMSDPNVIYWCNNQFLFRSSDGGVTFKNIVARAVSPDWWQSTGIDNVNMTDMAISQVNPNIVYAGFFDTGFWRSLDGGKSWQSSNDLSNSGSWTGYGGNVMSIAADPSKEEKVWTTMSGNQEGETPTVLLKSTKYGERGSWVLSNTGLPDVEVMGLSLDRLSNSSSRTMYVTAQGYLYKSTNDGAEWIKLTSGLPTDGGLRFTAVDNFYGSIVYAGGGNGLYASIDRGGSWTSIGNAEINGNGTLSFWGGGKGLGVFDIAPDPQTPGTVYVTVYGVGKGLYRGVKGSGATWAWTKLCTDNYMRKVSISPSNNNFIYATSSSAFTDGSYNISSHGVYFSNDKFATYSLVNNGMAWPFAMTVKCDSLNNVYVGSPGTGFQKAQIPGLPANGGLAGKLSEPEYITGNAGLLAMDSNDVISISPTIVENTVTVNKMAKHITVLDVTGKLICDYSNVNRFDMSAIKSGVYIVKVKMENVSVKTFKVVKL